MTIFVIILGLLVLANYSFPGSINYLAEVSSLIAMAQWSKTGMSLFATTAFFVTMYNIWTFTRLWGGYVDRERIRKVAPLITKEKVTFSIILIMTITFGLFGYLLGDLSNIK